MSEVENPFAGRATKNNGGSYNYIYGWVAAGLCAILAIVFLGMWSSARIDRAEVEGLRAKLNESADALAAARALIQTNQDQIAALQSQIADLQNDKQTAAQMANGLEDEMRKDLESKDVTISKLQGKLTVNILDRIMFDSGEAVLKPAGAAVMQKIADLLAKHPDIKIHVIGHTDNVPIRPSAHSRFASNWELSTARALAAVHCLTERMGVDPRRLGAVGYGEYRPIADNATPEGRARNRRIAITILPDELAGADTVGPVPGPAAEPVVVPAVIAPPTNAVPVLTPVAAPVAPPVTPPADALPADVTPAPPQ
jgi:chemotaxis protein MotB